MKIVETESIALKNYSLGEADKIILFLTKESGVLRLTVRGAKRLRNRFGGRIEPFTVANIVYGQKEEAELGRLISSEIVESFFYLARDLRVLNALAYFAEILTAITPPHEPNEKLYRMMRACLAAIAEIERQNCADLAAKLFLIVAYFEIWLLRLAGFLPDFRVCSKCRRSIRDRDVYFAALDAQVVCVECANSKRGEILNSDLKKFLRAALVLPPLEFVGVAENLSIENQMIEAITHRLLGRLLDYQPDYWSAVKVVQNSGEALETANAKR